MHYFIDGYNFLFRLLHGGENLQSQREEVIHDLNKKISLLNLDVSIVFDAAFHLGGSRTRSHYDRLEIRFTAEGETADEYLLHEIKNSKVPRQETVVTSDKILAKFVRDCSGRTQSVEEFISWLNRSYRNKLRRSKQEGIPVAAAAPVIVPPLSIPKTSSVPPADAPLEACTEYYARLFEAEWKEILKKDQLKKEAKAAAAPPLKRPPRKPRQKRDPFQPARTPESQESGEMERWLKLFEQKSKNKKDS